MLTRLPPSVYSIPNPFEIIAGADGWAKFPLPVAYLGSDTPSFTIACPGDVTGFLALGARLKLRQPTGGLKYFVVTQLTVASGATTINVYGGTSYTLTSENIDNLYFSNGYAPVGFPLNTTLWTETFTSTSDFTQSSPTASTWYNVGSQSLTIPIGLWNISYSCVCSFIKTASTQSDMVADLSTSTSSESHTQLRSRVLWAVSSNNMTNRSWHIRDTVLSFSSKTIMYLIILTSLSTVGSISVNGSLATTVIRAICRYI